jgi:hypothetical protein
MALVCREFYHHVFPLLFENIMICWQFDAYPGQDDNPPHYARFCRNIVIGDPHARTLAKHVKRYIIALFDLDTRSSVPALQVFAEHLAVYPKALTYMSNLCELYFFSSSITYDLLRSAALLPPLKVLQLENNCSVPHSLDKTLLAQFYSDLRVTHVRIHDRPVNDRHDPLIPHVYVPKQELFRHFCM